MTVIPSEGCLPPYSEMELEFVFQPHIPANSDVFAQTSRSEAFTLKYDTVAVIESIDAKHTIQVAMTGSVVVPLVTLSQNDFNFGDCPVHAHKDVYLTLENKSSALPANFEFSRIAHFSCKPSRGKLLPLQSQTVVVSFAPKNLGKFVNKMALVIEKGLKTYNMAVRGSSTSMGSRQKIVQGIDKLPQDFEDSVNLGGSEASLRPAKRVMKSTKDISPAGLARLDGVHDESTEAKLYTYTKEEYMFRQGKKLEATALITDGYKARAAQRRKEKYYVDPMDPVSMGMRFGQGLNEPNPPLPPPAESLQLQYSMAGYQGQARHKPRKKNKNISSGKKFKQQPTTQAERRDCDTVLSHVDLQSISWAPKALDFGRLFVGAVGKKQFSVSNDLDQHIIVQIGPELERELADSGPLSQMVPPGETADFDLVFTSDVVQSFNRSVPFTINGKHAYSFICQAEIVPISLDVTKEEVFFAFGNENKGFSVLETLEIKNPSNVGIDYWWTCPSGMFTITPVKGRLDEYQSAKIEILYAPKHAQKRVDSEICLNVKNGPSRKIACHASNPEATCQFKQRQLDFDIMSVGVPVTKSVVLRNTGKSRTVFKCEQLPAGVTVQPMTDRLPAGQSIPLNVTLNPSKPMEYNHSFLVDIRGRSQNGKPLKLNITGSSIIPDVEVEQDELNFEGITLGASKTLPLSILNRSPVTVTMLLDLSQQPEFSLSYPETWLNDEDCPVIRCNKADVLSPDPAATPANPGIFQFQGPPEETIYKFIIKAETTLSFEMMYTPTQVKTHAFELPLSLEGVPSLASIRRVVAAQGLQSKISVSEAKVDFEDRVVLKKTKALKNPYLKTFQITNMEQSNLDWWVLLPPDLTGVTSGKETPTLAHDTEIPTWRVEPSQGTLLPNQSCEICVQFVPVHPAEFNFKLGLMLGEPSGQPYLEVPVHGRGTHPRVDFSVDQVCLPTVPLGVTAKARFYIHNNGYDNIEIRHSLPLDMERLPFTISFPEGSSLSMVGVDKVPVQIEFTAEKATSFNSRIDFMDGDGNRFPLLVSGCSDNSLMTLQNFINNNRKTFELKIREGFPITLGPKAKHVPELALQEDRDTPGDGRAHTPSNIRRSLPHANNCAPEVLFERSVRSLLTYLASSALLPPITDPEGRVRDFPNDIMISNGKVVYDLVKALTGKMPVKPGKVSNVPKDAKNDAKAMAKIRMEQALEQFKTLRKFITFLKAHGGLVEHRAYYLLPHSEVSRLLKNEEFAALVEPVELQRLQLEDPVRFMETTKEAWLSILHQIVKIFIINRVTPRQFKTLPGIQPERAVVDPVSLGSNVYGVAETIILTWLSFHFNKLNPHRARQISNFDTHLADGLVIAAALNSHIPGLKSLESLIAEPRSEEHRMENAKRIQEAMEKMGLEYEIRPTDISQPIARDMFLFCLFLYQKLPSYVPKTTIEFKGSLDEEVIKQIELTNPSSKPITYTATLEGSSDFSVDATSVVLEPKGRDGSTIKFPVKFKPRFSRTVEGRLVFTSAGAGSANASTLVFLLKSQVSTSRAVVEHHIASSCYEPVTQTLKITNVFPQDCSFAVSLKVTHTPPAIQKKNSKKKSVVDEGADDTPLPPPFWVTEQTIKVKAGGTFPITLGFLPFRMGEYRCQLVFLDQASGEVMHEVVGMSSLPVAMETIKWSFSGRSLHTKDLPVSLKNSLLDKARHSVLDRIGGGRKSTADKSKRSQWELLLMSGEMLPAVSTYFVSCSSPYITMPSSVTVQQGASKSKDGRGKELADVSFPVTITPKNAGVYNAQVIFQSQADVRIVKLEVTVTEKQETPTLEFSTPARKPIVQDLPIINNSEESWTLSALLTGAGFSGSGSVQVPAFSTTNYKLTFNPAWVCDVVGKLELTNAKNGDKQVFELFGKGGEPLAEDHIAIECSARETVEKLLTVRNYSNGPQTFTIESDLPNISGEPSITVQGNSTAQYALKISPQLGGKCSGSIIFIGPDKRFQWYGLEVDSKSPTPEASLEISAFLRKMVSVEIGIVNPLDEVLEFEVRLLGHGLFGESFVTLGPQEEGTYEFMYSPLVAGVHTGSVSFINEKAGEFWYELTCEAKNPLPLELPTIEAQLSASGVHTLTLENPTEERISLRAQISNSKNFSTRPKSVTIPPFGSAPVDIVYTPCSIGQLEETIVTFKHPRAGEWCYHVTGVGVRPQKMPVTIVSTPVEVSANSSITFTNPFSHDISIGTSLQDNDGVFKLKVSKKKVSAGDSVQIPFSFCPHLIHDHEAYINVETQDVEGGVVWTFPIKGVAEGSVPDPSQTRIVSTQARSRWQDTIAVQLDGLPQGPLARPESFFVEMETDDENQRQVNRVLNLSLTNPTLQDGRQALQILTTFEPLRPMVISCNLVVIKQSGGRWKFPVILEGTEPEPDDVIRIEAMLNTTSSVSFSITNQYPVAVPYKAHFSPDSPMEFKVTPTSGTLQPLGSSERTQFIVSFTPRGNDTLTQSIGYRSPFFMYVRM